MRHVSCVMRHAWSVRNCGRCFGPLGALVPRRRVGEVSTHKQPPISAMESSSGAWPEPRVRVGWANLGAVTACPNHNPNPGPCLTPRPDMSRRMLIGPSAWDCVPRAAPMEVWQVRAVRRTARRATPARQHIVCKWHVVHCILRANACALFVASGAARVRATRRSCGGSESKRRRNRHAAAIHMHSDR